MICQDEESIAVRLKDRLPFRRHLSVTVILRHRASCDRKTIPEDQMGV